MNINPSTKFAVCIPKRCSIVLISVDKVQHMSELCNSMYRNIDDLHIL